MNTERNKPSRVIKSRRLIKRSLNSETGNLFQWLVKLFLAWRLALLAIVLLGLRLPLRKGYLGGGTLTFLKKPWLWSWANFDGVHYLTIAQRGYLQFQQAFFPFYPLFVRYLTNFTRDYLFSGLLLSHLALFISLFLFYQLVRLDFKKSIAKRSLIYLLIFPTSFFFGSLYTESLFLMLVLASFYAARKKRWGIAGILGAFASATRLVGIFLFPALLWEWYQQNKALKKKKIQDILPLFLITFGLLVYMWYLKRTVSDPFYFVHVQPFFGAQRTGGRMILLYQVFWRYLKMLITVEKMTPTYFTVVLEIFSGGLFLALAIFTYLRRWFSYLIFMALAYVSPTLTGTLSSMPRYVLILFPGFILLAIWAEKYKWLRICYPLVVIPLLVIALLLFSRGFFVA